MKKFAVILLFPLLFAAFAVPAQVSSNLPQIVAGGRFKLQGTTSQQVSATRGALVGIFVASSTSCTIKLWDNTAASGTVLVDTFSAAAATWYPLPFTFGTGLYLTVGGTCSYTVSYTK